VDGARRLLRPLASLVAGGAAGAAEVPSSLARPSRLRHSLASWPAAAACADVGTPDVD